MAYTKTNWVNNTTPLNATNMNKIEEGIAANDAALNTKASVDYVDKTHYGYSGDDLLIIPEGTTAIADNAYKNATYKCVVIPNSVTSIGNSAFFNCASLTSITIPDSVTSIGGSAFFYCSSLTEITIPNSVTSIGGSALASCTSLTNITIPDGVTRIDSSMFSGCRSLTSITIPDSVTSIGVGAFYYCPLATIDLTAYTTQSFPTLGISNFNIIASDCKIKVVKGRKAELIATKGWNNYASYVVEVPTVETLDTAIAAVKNGYLPLTGGEVSGSLGVRGEDGVSADRFMGGAFIGTGCSLHPATSTDTAIDIEPHGEGENSYLSISTDSFIHYSDFMNSVVDWTFTGISDSIGDSSTIAVSQKCLKQALENSRLPISAGTGTNSIVGNDLSTNTAISENAVSFGTNNKGGLKGYYWSNINLSAKTITLATTHTGGSPVTCGYAVGDVISIVNDSKFEECSVITAINGSVVTVNSFPFTKVATGVGDFSDYCIYCPAKANIGLADLGKAAWVAGSGNKGGNYCSVVAGRDNNVIGQYGVAMGRMNKVGYAGFSAGRDNTCTGQYGAVAGGSLNNLTASWSFAAGRANNLNGLYSGSFGRNNSAGVRGYYFTNSGSGNDILLYSNSACTTPANCSYAIGDILTAGIGARFINKVHITSFTGNKVTLSSRIDLSDYGANQRFIYCEQKSAIGAVAVTSYATAFGLNCKALGENSIAAGRNCVVPSTGGVAIGVDNRAGYSSFVGGGDNQTDKEYCVLLGNGNRVTANQSYAIGQGLKINSAHQCVVGRYNKQVPSTTSFIVGVGSGDNDRKNGMWVTQSGNMLIGGSKLTLNANGTPVTITAEQLEELLKFGRTYTHYVWLTDNVSGAVFKAQIANNASTAFTVESFADYLGTGESSVTLTGIMSNNGNTAYIPATIERVSDNTLYVRVNPDYSQPEGNKAFTFNRITLIDSIR